MKQIIHIIIPTLDRYQSLIQTIKSLNINSNFRDFMIHVVVDGNKPYYKRLGNQNLPNTRLIFNPVRIGWGKSINMVIRLLEPRMIEEAINETPLFFSASDDLQFDSGTLGNALFDMNQHFPDGDGVIGIRQDLKHFCPAAFSLVGNKFVNRFPDRQLYNPIYDHFCVDSELWHYALSEKKFFFSKNALVVHRRYQDDCHRLAQKTLKADRLKWWAKKGKPELYWPKVKVVKNG